MEQTKKLLQEEINSITTIRQKTTEKIGQFGEIELELIYLEKRKKQILETKENLIKELNDIQTSEIELTKNLQEKYGQGTLNLENGEFIPGN